MKNIYNLPKEYKSKHKYCIDVYDQILGLFLSIENINARKVKIPDGRIIDIESFRKLTGEDLYKWLIDNNCEDVIFEMNYKECFAALLSDLLQFILTSLKCSEKGQLNITYALLRKPLKDNLFYLEYLLANPAEFIREFNDQRNAEIFAVDKKSPENKKKDN